MLKIVKCPICGEEFKTSRKNKKYCSFSCKEAGQTVRRTKWELKNPDYVRNYMREYMKNYRKKQKDPCILPENQF